MDAAPSHPSTGSVRCSSPLARQHSAAQQHSPLPEHPQLAEQHRAVTSKWSLQSYGELDAHDASVTPPRRTARHTFKTWLFGTFVGQVSVALLLSSTLVFTFTGVWLLLPECDSCDYDNTFGEALWLAWGVFFDPGTQTGLLPDQTLVSHKVVAAVFSVFGFVFNLAVLGVIVEWIRATISRYKKHHKTIVANGHVVVLGWTDKTLFLLEELAQMLHARRWKRAVGHRRHGR